VTILLYHDLKDLSNRKVSWLDGWNDSQNSSLQFNIAKAQHLPTQMLYLVDHVANLANIVTETNADPLYKLKYTHW
jgi:hypothetical protein